jgi:GGDEF domain-containing protein
MSVDEMLQIAPRVIVRLEQPWSVSGKVFLSAPPSIGIAIYPDDGGTPEILLKHDTSRCIVPKLNMATGTLYISALGNLCRLNCVTSVK